MRWGGHTGQSLARRNPEQTGRRPVLSNQHRDLISHPATCRPPPAHPAQRHTRNKSWSCAEGLHGEQRGRGGRELQVNGFCCWGAEGEKEGGDLPLPRAAPSQFLSPGAEGPVPAPPPTGRSGSGEGLCAEPARRVAVIYFS